MKQLIKSVFTEATRLRQELMADPNFVQTVVAASEALIECVENDGTIYTCGNGGSACDAMHFCEELVARYKRERRGIKAQHFMDPGTVSCWANDYIYDSAFERQVETFCGKKDVLVGFSTSGNSENVNRAVRAAKETGTTSIGLIGRDGGALYELADLAIVIPSEETERIQELHITLVHIFMEIIEVELFEGAAG